MGTLCLHDAIEDDDDCVDGDDLYHVVGDSGGGELHDY